MLSVIKNKTSILFLFYVFTNIVYLFLYTFFLETQVTIYNVFFVLTFCTLYFLSILLYKNIFASTIRLVLVFALIIINLLNLLYFKTLNTFIPLGKGLVFGLTKAQANLLFGYISDIPIILFIYSFLFFLFFVFIEFYNYKKIRISKKIIVTKIVLLLILLLAVTTLIIYKPNKSWSSISKYQSDLGPFGHMVTQTIGNLQDLILVDRIDIEQNLFNQTKQAINELAQMQDIKVLPSELGYTFKEPPNIIIYQLESISQWAVEIEPTPMPFLSSLISENITVSQFYANDCHTIGAEFNSMCSLLPDSHEVISRKFLQPEILCLPQILSSDLSYQTSVYHSNLASFWNRDKVMPLWGFKNLYFSPFFEVRATDDLVLDTMLQNNKNIKNPTLDYFISFTSHGPHKEENLNAAFKDHNLKIIPYTYQLDQLAQEVDLPEEELRIYLGYLKAVDDSIKNLFANLKSQDKLKNTIVVIYGDHRYYGFDDNLKYYQEYNQIPFVMYIPGIKSQTLPIVASHIDIAPTVLDILGQEQKNYQFIGKSIFSDEHSNQAIGKCSDEVYLFNSELILQGNLFANSYQVLEKNINFTEQKEQQYIQKFSKAIELSDRLLSYPLSYTFKDGTLVKGKGKEIYIIKNNTKHLLPTEGIYQALGGVGYNVHEIYDQHLQNILTGNDVTTSTMNLYK